MKLDDPCLIVDGRNDHDDREQQSRNRLLCALREAVGV